MFCLRHSAVGKGLLTGPLLTLCLRQLIKDRVFGAQSWILMAQGLDLAQTLHRRGQLTNVRWLGGNKIIQPQSGR